MRRFPERLDALGCSFGGGVAFMLAAHHPSAVRRLAIVHDATRYDICFSPQLLPTVLPFLDGKGGAKNCDQQVEDTRKP